MKISQIIALIATCTLAAAGVTAIASPVKANPEEAQVFLKQCYIIHHKLKDYQSAEAACTQAISLHSEYAEAYLFRGGARLHLENYQGADADFSRAAELFQQQNNPEGYQTAQKLLGMSQDLQRKLRELNQGR
ncbi:hypothetical protein [Merismopedia glauca]|uniref:Uncharacterized protein n=1 Tax=Merismopedia glauca CCAP 1448/3 TaxID=1296344 RepID=A0A2T1C239_9CYAN|nr:hypothetical protein [Merismopedia glauca]PSB02340.1 hypothetical protein C7B64_13685 [Merismopedia glauca CCAP 1448/3]